MLEATKIKLQGRTCRKARKEGKRKGKGCKNFSNVDCVCTSMHPMKFGHACLQASHMRFVTFFV